MKCTWNKNICGHTCSECINDLEQRKLELETDNVHYREVLGLIASPKRPDGTYNRDRQACEQLAKDVLERFNQQHSKR